jgi:F0F1-type ATP synthase membrane subunit b/b'
MTTQPSPPPDPQLVEDTVTGVDLPQFASVMRGYDRGQVDDYVARLNDFLSDAERRAVRAERGLTDALRRNERLTEELRTAIERQSSEPSARAPYEGLGERIESMLRLAADEADALRERGRAEAAELLDEAKREREQEVQAAERDLAAVAERRDSVVTELRRVQDVLATLGLRQAVNVADADTGEIDLAAAEQPTTVIDLRELAARADAVG